jgi:ribosome biogenesis GTPase
MSQPPTIPGWVTRLQSGFYTVATAGGVVTCRLRGRLKRRTFAGDVIAVGDRVQVSLQSDGSGAIESIEPRERELVRLDPTPRGDYRQILFANLDQVVLVFACANPEPHLGMLDRFLVICEKQRIPPLIVINKIDLLGRQVAEEKFAVYPRLGYPTPFTSARQGIGGDDLRRRLTGRVSALAGPSGAGKSSLLNAVQPDLGLVIGRTSGATGKGRHTTVVREMFPLEGSGYVADLPGLKALALWDTEPEEIDGYFPELRALVPDCQFNDCTHTHEPQCAVLGALAAGRISPGRYASYLRLRDGGD